MLAQPIKITVTVHNLNRLDEPVFIAVSKPLLTEFGIYLGLESCEYFRPPRIASSFLI